MTARPWLVLFLILWAVAPRAQAADNPVFDLKVTGEGPDILMIPGLASSMAVWDDTAARLRDRYRIHQVTLAGFAGVAPVIGPVLTVRRDALVSYLEREDLTDVTVVGHSLGGAMAMMVAEAAPDRVGRLVIVDSLPFLAQLFFGVTSLDAARPIANNLRATQEAQPPALYARQQKAGLAIQTKQADRRPMLQRWLESSDRGTLIKGMHALLTLDLRPRLKNIPAETTVIYAHDRLMPITPQAQDELYEAQYRGLPNKTLVRIDDSFHFVMFDRPDAFHEALEQALRDGAAPE